MKAMILAAGRGERMRPLTDSLPKPLLQVGKYTLIEHHLFALADASFREVVINIAYRGAQIRKALGNGERYGLSISYSDEGEAALETAGGIKKALPLLGDEPFVVINGDIWCDYPLAELALSDGMLAHLVMVPNPEHNPAGDFELKNRRQTPALITQKSQQTKKDSDPFSFDPFSFTFSGIGVYHTRFFDHCPDGPYPLRPLLDEAIDADKVSGELHQGIWIDIGTPERLTQLNRSLAASEA